MVFILLVWRNRGRDTIILFGHTPYIWNGMRVKYITKRWFCLGLWTWNIYKKYYKELPGIKVDIVLKLFMYVYRD